MTVSVQKATSRAAAERAEPNLLKWAPAVAFGLLLLSLSRHAAAGISDPDTPWHVLAGRYLWDTWQFSGPDPFSRFTTGPWVLNQWLPELIFAAADHVGGLAAVAWLAQVGRLTVCLLLYAACRRQAGGLPAALVAGVAVLGTADSLSPRPQLVGFALLAVTLDAWLRTTTDVRPRWWLMAVSYVWSCSHGTWVVGITVGIAAVAGLALDRRIDLRAAVRLAAIPAGSALLAVLTPVGPALLGSFRAVRAVSPYIQEWRLPTTPTPSVIATATLLLLVPLGWLLARRTFSWTTLALWLVALAWGVSSMRTVAVGAIVIAPLAASALNAMIGRPWMAASRGERGFLGLAALLAVALSAALAAGGPRNQTGVPHAFDRTLAAMPRGTVVYNSDLLGGWLMYRYPGIAQTADTRVELYGPSSARDYLDVMAARRGWEQGLAHFAPAAAIVEQHLPLVDALRTNGWQERGRDAGYVLLIAP
ncbi:hypothetical protein SAMN05216199_3636 [Pedococcus cremeus]|uniref:Glycosyltransferase RgtA/B/C/D-like domain-containing protein n=1 Tax=Pedococcus cremeus TaxID=587636 RepID=A0A1H9XBU9_9MICO|nr:hypothetical protein [Pedococcus cremeus]SES43604.1 hypothetical protein SAMN05216199_3636 [Pedococcus cremeus]